MQTCTIVMYHYVRDIKNCRYPELKALDMSSFRRQLDYIQAHYMPVTAEDIRDCLDLKKNLPQNACLLTFDDGYLDHYTNVFPELVKRGISGCFYPPVAAVHRSGVLDVNKIHLILAREGYSQIDRLLGELKSVYCAIQGKYNVPDFVELYSQYAIKSRFDSAEVVYFKRVLQHVLPPKMRSEILNTLFYNIMDVDEGILAKELYVSIDMLNVMAKNGMHIGSHGDKHIWLDKVDSQIQNKEIQFSLDLLSNVYEGDDFFWSISYPFGGENLSLRNACKKFGCAFGLTTIPQIAQVEPSGAMHLARIDANDLELNLN